STSVLSVVGCVLDDNLGMVIVIDSKQAVVEHRGKRSAGAGQHDGAGRKLRLNLRLRPGTSRENRQQPAENYRCDDLMRSLYFSSHGNRLRSVQTAPAVQIVQASTSVLPRVAGEDAGGV